MTTKPGFIAQNNAERDAGIAAVRSVAYFAEMEYYKKMSGGYWCAAKCWAVLPNGDQPIVAEVRNENFLGAVSRAWENGGETRYG